MSKSRDLGEFPAAALDIDSSGNVGIGTNSPGTFNQRVNAPHLVVGSGANSSGLTVYSGPTNQASINFATGVTGSQQYDGGLTYAPGGSAHMAFHVGGGVERMRLDSAGNLGIGTSSVTAAIQVAKGTTVNGGPAPGYASGSACFGNDTSGSAYGLVMGAAGTGAGYISAQRTDGTAQTYPLHLQPNGGNVGIGTSSPSQAKLEVLAESDYSSHTGHGISIVSNANDVYTGMYMGTDDTIDAAYIQSAGINFSFTSKDLLLNPNGGNVGIGVTDPGSSRLSISGTGTGANPTLAVNNSSTSTFMHTQENLTPNMTSGQTNLLVLGSASSTKNAGYLGYKFSAAGSDSNLLTLGHWGNDNLVVLDGAGNCGIGTNSPRTTLDLGMPTLSSTLSRTLTDYQMMLEAPSGGGSTYAHNIGWSEITGSDVVVAAINAIDLGASSATGITFATGNSASISERVRIDSTGNVGIGTSTILSPAAGRGVLTLSGSASSFLNFGTGSTRWGGVYSDATKTVFLSDNIATFEAGNVERMRILSNGDILMGASVSTGGAKLEVTEDAGNLAFFKNSSGVGLVMGAGGTAWVVTSDERIKDIIEPITGAMSKLSTLRTVIGKYKVDPDGTRRPFLIAQDVQAVFPEVVNTQDDEDGTLGIEYTSLIPAMIAGMKEQQTLIEALTARITALEAK